MRQAVAEKDSFLLFAHAPMNIGEQEVTIPGALEYEIQRRRGTPGDLAGEGAGKLEMLGRG